MDVEKIVKIANEYGFILSSKAIQFLKETDLQISENEFINFLKKYHKIIVDPDDIIKAFSRDVSESKAHSDVEPSEKIEILKDPGRNVNPGPSREAYIQLLKDRYRKLSLKIRRNMGSLKPIKLSEISSRSLRNSEVSVIVYLLSKRVFEDRILIEIEDETSISQAYVYKKFDQKAFDMILKAPLDVVLGLKLFISSRGKPIVKDVIPPRIKTGFEARPGRPIYVLFISDLHIGSKKFNHEVFNRFIEILKGVDVGDQIKKIVDRLRYIIIAGDIVDGVGVYQGQENELEIPDIREQYDEAYKLLRDIPSKCKVIIIPGNHDASRSALPQPPIFKNVAEKFYNDEKFIMLGNPVNINLHGVNILIYHGDFIQDILTTIPGIQNGDVGIATNILLTYSHLAPQIGLSTKIAPEFKDDLVIDDGINILHFGHTHKFNISKHLGVLTINSGTFQNQTKYQKIMRIDPDIGYLTFVNLNNLEPQVVRILE